MGGNRSDASATTPQKITPAIGIDRVAFARKSARSSFSREVPSILVSCTFAVSLLSSCPLSAQSHDAIAIARALTSPEGYCF